MSTRPETTPSPRWLIIGIAVIALIGAAVIDRRVSDVRSGDVKASAAKLEGVPREFGAWMSTEVPMDEKIVRVAEAAGYVSRSYTNRKTGARVGVLLLCGPTGPIGAHEPKYCYAGNGFDMSGTPEKKAVALPGGATATYWSVRFEKKSSADEPPVRVCWTWGADGEWRAAADPRTEYALHRALYKLYVTRAESLTPTGVPVTTVGNMPDPVHEFLTDFLPEVNKALAAPPAP
jgi:hypothetical protein